jgi:hypothetical protein
MPDLGLDYATPDPVVWQWLIPENCMMFHVPPPLCGLRNP